MAPVSLYRCLYAHCSPIDMCEPSGEFIYAQTVAAMSIAGTLLGISIYHYTSNERSLMGYFFPGFVGATVGAVAGHYAFYTLPQTSWWGPFSDYGKKQKGL